MSVDVQLVASMKLASALLLHPVPVTDSPEYVQRCIPLTESEKHVPEQADPRHALLRALHPTGFIDLRALHTDRPAITTSVLAADLAAVDAFAARHRDRSVFFGVATRRDADSRNAAGCDTLHALFADIDFKDFRGFADPEAEARKRLAAFPFSPSAIVATGGGLHSYWFLTEPLDLQRGGAARVGLLLRALATALGGDLNAAEIARILRLADRVNRRLPGCSSGDS